MIKCIIFDCDGTLVDSEYLCNLGLEILLRNLGVESSAITMMAHFRGRKLATILEDIESKHHIKLPDNFVSSYRELVNELFEKELKPCDGVNDALAEIELAKCVASNGPLQKIYKALSLCKQLAYFDGNIFSSYKINSWKPDPGIFLHAAKEMGFQANECAVVEDSPVGITAAIAAGMRPILYDPHAIHQSVSCLHTIRHMKELKDVII